MNETIVQKLLEIAKKHGKEIAIELINEVLEPALKEAVSKSSTPIDDAVVAALLPSVKAELLKLIEKI